MGGANIKPKKLIVMKSLVDLNWNQWKATIGNSSSGANGMQKLMYKSPDMSLGVISQFGDFHCIGDFIRALRATSGVWQVASEPPCMSLHV